ncbi:cobalamin biosynthesis protein [Thermomonas carbonis]|uniref:Regulatory signaling modulator protein AmpE n=1 Tax=Thermomonas carbonis TaxID=1463158 RepID=A0A7G9SRX7_9GAMM|nr:cobalamin biosynthesis protein [Thermomonas carbonis]QNN70602.1 regulatory signaling modulator protein AmpE [Thermomonas carbonis]GHC01055.1 membrane protein [Thermomonas carbonis]
MSATLLAVIIALAIGHLAPGIANGLRQFGWYRSWLQWLNAQFPEDSVWRSRWGIALALVVPLLVAGLLQVALDQPLWGFVGLLFDIVVLFWCWGPRDLDLDVAAILDAPDAASRRAAAARLYPPGVDASLDGASLVEAVFRNAQRRWFGVLFWFCVLGPFGALLYRLSVLAAEQDADALPQDTLQGARLWLSLLEWPVTQLIALALALVGNFDSVLSAWREENAFGLDSRLLPNAARASVRSEIADEVADYAESGISPSTALAEVFGELPELRDAMNLAWRVLVLWLAVIALFVVAGWVS